MAVLTDIAEAVKDELNLTTFDLPFVAKRVHGKEQLEPKDLECLRVEVAPVGLTCELADRSSAGHDVTVDVFLRQKFGTDQQNDETGEIRIDPIDVLEKLAEDIAVHFQPEQPTRDGSLGDTAAFWKSGRLMMGFANDKFAQTRVWMAQIRLVFQIL